MNALPIILLLVLILAGPTAIAFFDDGSYRSNDKDVF